MAQIDIGVYAHYRALEQASRNARYDCLRVVTSNQMEQKLINSVYRADVLLSWLDTQLDGQIQNRTQSGINGILQERGCRYQILGFI
jgi:hypothetical protein